MTTTTQNQSASTLPSTPGRQIINWFEIPVSDIARSTALYEAMLNTRLALSDFGGVPHAVIASADKTCVSGALVADPQRPPKRGGASTVLYLDAADGVARCLARAIEAGARVVQPETAIGPHGTIALIEDHDGNVIGLHANPQ